MANALAAVEYDIVHVVGHPENTHPREGNCNVPDPRIAQWCGEQQRVLVTLDHDFRTKWLKGKVLADAGAEVIVFSKDIKGLTAQHLRVTKHISHWISDLGAGSYEHRVWMQTTKEHPTQVAGPKPK